MSVQYHIFLSYSRTDKVIMQQVTADLRRDGFSVWNDESLEPGTPSWKDAIEEAIESSRVVVVLLSPDAKKSEWIERELDYARAQNVLIIPVMVRGDVQNAVPFELISVQRADMRSDYQAGYRSLREGLCDQLKLPELCPEKVELPAPPALPPARTEAPSKVLPGDPIQLAGRMRAWNPLDYGKLLYLYLFDPEQLYKHDPNGNRTVAVWLVSTLLWLPLLWNTLSYQLSEVPLWGTGQEPVQIIPTWFIIAGWLLTGFIGQINFEVRSGMWAFLRGPLRMVSAVIGVGSALLYAGTIFYAFPPLEIHDGLVYLLTTPQQQWLIVAGGLSVFAAAVLAHSLARGFSQWLSIFMAAGLVALIALAVYIPLGERLAPALPAPTANSDITANGMMVYASVTCCLGALLWVAGAVTSGALRQRQVSGFNFLLLAALVASYGLFVWVHVLSGG